MRLPGALWGTIDVLQVIQVGTKGGRMITLYGTANTRAFRVLWMLEELGVPFEHVKTDFASGATRTPEFLRINPNGHVPALVDGDLRLFESLAINLYLAERHGAGTLWPAGIEDRARALQWSFWVMTECEAHTFAVLFASGGGPNFAKWRAWTESEEFRATHPSYTPPDRQAATAALELSFRVLDEALARGPYLLGETFGVADLNVASVLVTVRLAAMSLAAFPNLDAWLTRCTARPALAAAARR
jgi:glutathione S-transferase